MHWSCLGCPTELYLSSNLLSVTSSGRLKSATVEMFMPWDQQMLQTQAFFFFLFFLRASCETITPTSLTLSVPVTREKVGNKPKGNVAFLPQSRTGLSHSGRLPSQDPPPQPASRKGEESPQTGSSRGYRTDRGQQLPTGKKVVFSSLFHPQKTPLHPESS